jgi:hypothetical protein
VDGEAVEETEEEADEEEDAPDLTKLQCFLLPMVAKVDSEEALT